MRDFSIWIKIFTILYLKNFLLLLYRMFSVFLSFSFTSFGFSSKITGVIAKHKILFFVMKGKQIPRSNAEALHRSWKLASIVGRTF